MITVLLVLAAAARWVTFAAIFVTIGAIVFHFIIVPRAGLEESSLVGAAQIGSEFGSFAAQAIVPAALVRLIVQTAQMRFSDDSWIDVGWQLLAHTSWGRAWWIQVALAIAILIVFNFTHEARRGPWLLAALLAFGLSVTPTLGSHAISATEYLALSVVTDWVHVVAAGTWVGTLVIMYFTVREYGNAPADRQSMLAWLAVFSPIALGAVAVVLLTGTVSAVLRLHDLHALYTTLYGRTLILKLIAVASVLVLGWMNWRRNTPMVTTSGPSPIRAGMRLEIIAMILVLLVSAFLVTTPLPMESM